MPFNFHTVSEQCPCVSLSLAEQLTEKIYADPLDIQLIFFAEIFASADGLERTSSDVSRKLTFSRPISVEGQPAPIAGSHRCFVFLPRGGSRKQK